MVRRTSTSKFLVSDVDGAANLTIRDVLGNRSDAAGTGTVMGMIKRVDTRQVVPSQDAADNGVVSAVVGNKTDTGTSGNSLVSLAKKNNTDILAIDAFHDVPTADSADNVVMSDVLGNKTDTVAGDSLYSESLIIDAALLHRTEDGTVSYLDAGGERTIAELTPSSVGLTLKGIWLDLVNMTNDGVIKIYYKIDGSNYRLIESYDFTVATDPDGYFINLVMGITNDFKVTYTESADEGDDRNVPFQIVYVQSDTP
jgi:hypothetical protein